MKRIACILLIVTILVSGLFIARNVHAQASSGTSVGGTLTSNAEWTLGESPINFNESVTVDSGVTLTVDAGVTVNFGMYGLLVYGTLIAQGNANDQIVFTSNIGSGNTTISNANSDSIFFVTNASSSGSTNTTSVIQNAVLNGIDVNVDGLSPEIDSCVFNYAVPSEAPINIDSSSPAISDNIINYNAQSSASAINTINVYGGTPLITSNQFEGSFDGSTNIAIDVTSGAPAITSNTFAAYYCNNSFGVKVTSGTPQITSNRFEGGGYLTGIDDSSTSSFTVSNNVFSDCYSGVTAEVGSTLTVQGNQFMGGKDGIDIVNGATVTVTDNLIDSNSRYGINGGGTITSNTISNNQIGVHNPPTGVISNNNIVGSTVNSITSTIENVDAQNNWWGIADAATINRTIYDSKVDPHLGTVFFVPFLTQPSTSAPPIPSYTPTITPVPTQTPTPTAEPVTTPTPTPDNYSQTFAYQVGTLLNLNLIVTATAIILVLAWVILILGYATKRGISKHKSKN